MTLESLNKCFNALSKPSNNFLTNGEFAALFASTNGAFAPSAATSVTPLAIAPIGPLVVTLETNFCAPLIAPRPSFLAVGLARACINALAP